jgi:NADH-quinone oxidoreductase subunit J
MSGSTIIFYLLAAMALVFAALSVTTRQIFRAAIYLLFTLISIAGIYFWLQYEFIAAVQIVVYVGGIVVLIIFSIFLTQQTGEKLPKQKLDRKIFAALAVFAGFALTILQIYQHDFYVPDQIAISPTVQNIGKKMLTVDDGGYALPFEVISMLLLAAMIGCIVIALREKKIIEPQRHEGTEEHKGIE